jgi:hypothetical protein
VGVGWGGRLTFMGVRGGRVEDGRVALCWVRGLGGLHRFSGLRGFDLFPLLGFFFPLHELGFVEKLAGSNLYDTTKYGIFEYIKSYLRIFFYVKLNILLVTLQLQI